LDLLFAQARRAGQVDGSEIATNNPLAFSDKSDGLWRRMLLIKFMVQIPKEERVAGMDTAAFWLRQGEVPGIFNWALAGLFRLRKEGRFNLDPEIQADIDDMRGDVNPAKRFLLEFYEAGPGHTECAVIYDRYRDWCKAEGHFPQANIGFGREVSRAFRGAKRDKVTIGNCRPWCYCGVQKKDVGLGV
jgi:phage/plasmid-associated DNA primase